MDWFYAANGQQAGPVSDEQLFNLVRAGTVTPQTLVWHHGMAQWQPYATVTLAEAAPPVVGHAPCVECGRSFPAAEMIAYDQAFVCAACKPVFFQKLKEGVAPGAAQLWRTKKDLVMAKSVALPERCVKCNAPATGEHLKRNLHWHPPWIYLLIILSILIYIIVALIIQKRAVVHIGLCAEHRQARRTAMAVGWGLFLGGGGTITAAVLMESGWAGFAGSLLVLAGMIYGAVRCRMVHASRIDETHIWLRGVGPAFLEALPEWIGRK